MPRMTTVRSGGPRRKQVMCDDIDDIPDFDDDEDSDDDWDDFEDFDEPSTN